MPQYKVSEKQLVLLRALERRSKFPGHVVALVPHFDYPLAWAESEAEFAYHLASLAQRGLIDTPKNTYLEETDTKAVVSPSGWDFLDGHSRTNAISDQVFVAMSFGAELTAAWETAIRPALLKAQFRPYRIDAQPHIDRIDTKIISEIKNSRFVVADVTQQRPGVYFEAGYAIGLGLPVIWCVRHDDLNNVHFDTRQYNHIVWKDEEHLAEQLLLFVTAVVGTGSTPQ